MRICFRFRNCNITEEELKYFDGENRMVSQGLCGINYYRNIIPRILDEMKYPIFKIKSFELVKLDVYEISATINSKIIGNIEGYNGTGNSFSVLIFLEYNNTNHSEIMNCEIGIPSIEQINSFDLILFLALISSSIIIWKGLINSVIP